jgi:hypothetical protein
VTPLMAVPFWAVKNPAIEPAPTADPGRAAPVPFWVTSRAVPVLAVVSVVFEIPALLAVLPIRSGSPAAAAARSGAANRPAMRPATPPIAPARMARRDYVSVGTG